MRMLLAACAMLCALPSLASGLVVQASVLQPLPFDIKHATAAHPVSVEAVTEDGQCSIQIEFARYEYLADEQDNSMSGRVKLATCGRQVIDSGFATGTFRRVGDGLVEIDGKIEVVLLLDE